MFKTVTLLALVALLMFSCSKHQKDVNFNYKKVVEPIYLSSDEGERWDLFGVKITGKVLSEDTNGAYAIIVTETPPGNGPPLHVHKNEDELFYILKGNYTFNYGDKVINASTGDFIRLPKGVPHKFVNKDTITGITMNTITPGGFEKFFMEMSVCAEDGALEKYEIDSIAKKYEISFLKN